MPLVRKTAPKPSPSGAFDWRAQATLLQTGSPDERFSAARALAVEPLAVPALAEALAEAIDLRLREAIFTSLAQQDSSAAFDAILHHLRSEDAQWRSFALDAMRLMPAQTAAQLPVLLRDRDSDIRVLACELARQLPSGTACPLLVGLLKLEKEVNVCAAAIEVLAEIGGLAELPALAACAARFPAERFLNFSVRTTLERIHARTGP